MAPKWQRRWQSELSPVGVTVPREGDAVEQLPSSKPETGSRDPKKKNIECIEGIRPLFIYLGTFLE